jgi:hypothetical protein
MASKKPGRYEGSPGVETFGFGLKKGSVLAIGGAQATAEELEGKTREELLEMLRKASISPQEKGSQPRATKAGVGGDDVESGSSISKSSSSSSSLSEGSTSSSSAEDKSSVPPSAQGE